MTYENLEKANTISLLIRTLENIKMTLQNTKQMVFIEYLPISPSKIEHLAIHYAHGLRITGNVSVDTAGQTIPFTDKTLQAFFERSRKEMIDIVTEEIKLRKKEFEDL